MSTTTAPAVAPSTALTVGQAVAGLSERLKVIVDARLGEFADDMKTVLASGAFLTEAATEEECEELADARKKAKSLQKELNDARLELTRRVDTVKSEIKGPFDKEIAKIEAVVEKITEAARPYVERKAREAEEERLRQLEIRRKAQEAADAEARKAAAEKAEAERKAAEAKAEEERLEREREAAKTKKQREELELKLAQARQRTDEAQENAAEAGIIAQGAQESAQAAAAPVNLKPQGASVKSVSGASLGLTTVWQHEIVDPSQVPLEFWKIDEDAIAAQYANEVARKRIADANGNPQIPGVRIFKGAPRMASR